MNKSFETLPGGAWSGAETTRQARASRAKMRLTSISEVTNMTQRERIAEEALKLPPEDRAYLADRLEGSLPYAGFATPELAKAWAVEVTRRLEAHDRGEAEAVNFDAALERMRRRVKEYRETKDAK